MFPFQSREGILCLEREQVLQFAACFSCSSPDLSSQQVNGEIAPASHSGVNYEEGPVGGLHAVFGPAWRVAGWGRHVRRSVGGGRCWR